MIKTIFRTIVVLLLVGQSIFLLNGCSLFSSGIVLASNAGKPEWTAISLEEVNNLNIGTILLIQLKNDYDLLCEYNGYEKQSDLENNIQLSNKSKILIKAHGKEKVISSDEIEQINIKTKKDGIISAMLTGAVVDGVLIYLYFSGAFQPNISLNF